MNIARLLEMSATIFADRPAAVVGRSTRLTYAHLEDRVSRLAGTLRSRFALAHGDRIALAMSNCPEFLEVLFGGLHGGLSVVPMNAKLHLREFAYMLENSGARLCFATPDIAGGIGVGPHPHPSGARDVAMRWLLKKACNTSIIYRRNIISCINYTIIDRTS